MGDLDNPYITYDNKYIETLWWLLKQLYDKDLLYKGYTIQPYSPAAGTGLSSHELNQPGCYRDVKDTTVTAQFAIIDPKPEMTEWGKPYFLAWTTTPWTLAANSALCVGPNIDYVAVQTYNGYTGEPETVVLAEVLVPSYFNTKNENNDLASYKKGDKVIPYKIVAHYKGSDLVGMKYEQLLPMIKPMTDGAFRVIPGDYVTTEDGTGIVHIAPAFGEDDAKVGRKYEMPFVQLVDERGNMSEETPFAGLFVKKADPEVLKDLESRGLLYDAPKFEHSYPHCWRCDTPLIYYARESWFIKMTDVKDQLIANNNTVNWVPKSIGKGRFGDWLENVQDWGISRNRYWGTPLNIWECECGHQHSIGSIEELKSMSDNCPDDIELHRPYIDQVTIKCPHCGKPMHRVEEVIDCWFDSGSMPFAQWHYPFENKEIFEDNFPANFISEAVDQTRGWFYSLMAISTLLFNKAPYKNVVVLGHVQDENGQKMSKSKGNAVDPFDALEEHGADAIRWYFYTNSAPWLPNRFHAKAVTEGQRKFMGTLWNTYAFYTLYAEIDQFDPTKHALEYDKLSVMDKWLLSKMNTMVKSVDDNLGNYRIPEAARALQEFVDDMSNWYVRRCRDRFWAKGMEQDKVNAYMTLYTALVTVCKAAAPMIPFMTEEIYQNIVRSVDASAKESIHLCDFPVYNAEQVDEKLEADMDLVLKIVVLGRACRNGAAIKNRQPIGQMYVKAEASLPDYDEAIILDELNVKNITFTDDVSNFTTYNFKPQLKTVGPKYGKLVGGIRNYLAAVDGNEAKAQLDSKGVLTFEVDGTPVELAEEDLLIEMVKQEGFVTEADNGVTVVLDTNLSEELLEEGFVREVVSKIQSMRKEAGFEVTDHITFSYKGSDKAADIIGRNEAAIAGDVLADEVKAGEVAGYEKEWNINGEKVTLGVEKRIISYNEENIKRISCRKFYS